MGRRHRQRAARDLAFRLAVEREFRGNPTFLPSPDACRVCGKPVRLMIYRGTGFCCQLCESAAQ